MRRASIAVSLVLIVVPLSAQAPPRGRVLRPSATSDAAESAIKQAAEQLASVKKICDRDIEVLAHLRASDKALADPMQPENAVQKAYEEVEAAKGLVPGFVVMQGLIRVENELEGARRSPVSADFGRLRSLLREQALAPASRVAVRNALSLEDEARSWMKVQQLIGDHIRNIVEISGDSLRVSEQE